MYRIDRLLSADHKLGYLSYFLLAYVISLKWRRENNGKFQATMNGLTASIYFVNIFIYRR